MKALPVHCPATAATLCSSIRQSTLSPEGSVPAGRARVTFPAPAAWLTAEAGHRHQLEGNLNALLHNTWKQVTLPPCPQRLQG